MIVSVQAWRRVRAHLPLVALIGLVTVGACGDDNNNVVPLGAVTTFKDSTFDFTTLHTFSMPDTVAHLTAVSGTPIAPTGQFDATILNRVRSDFIARGYTEVADPATVTPDFVVLVGATATENFNAFVSFPWFNFWGFFTGFGSFTPDFSPTWGIVFPWFPSVGVTSFNRGTLIVDLIPTSEIDVADETIRAAWSGVATSLIGSTNVTTAIINAAIDAMFNLSPYLTASPTP